MFHGTEHVLITVVPFSSSARVPPRGRPLRVYCHTHHKEETLRSYKENDPIPPRPPSS